MPLNDIITVSTQFASPPLGVPSLTIPICAAILTAPQDAAWDAAFGAAVDVIEVTGATWQTTLDTLGVTAGEDLQVALTDMFSQRFNGAPSQPATILIARRATAVPQVNTVTINGVTDGTFTHTVNGVDFNFVAVAQTDEQIRDGLLAAIALGSEPVTTAPVATTQYTVTANEAGVPFTSSVTSTGVPADITQVVTTPNTGIGEDIANWNTQDDSWYFLLETTRSSGVIQTAAEVVEGLTPNRVFMAQTNDPLAQTGASTDDLASVLGSAGLGLTRTALVWHDNDDQFVDWALVGKMSGFDPGIPNWANQSLASVTGISAPILTSGPTLETKRYTFLESFTAPVPPQSMTRVGQMLDGNWIDIVHGVDALNLTIQIRVFQALLDNNVPYQGGEPHVDGAIRGALSEFEGPPGAAFLVEGASTVGVPDAATQSLANRLGRRYEDVLYGALAQGKVNKVDILGFLEQ